MASRRTLAFWSFFDVCLLAAGIICLIFAIVWNGSGDPLRHLVIDNGYLDAGLVFGALFLATFAFSIVAIIQPNHVILPLAILNWALIVDALAVVTIGTIIWWATLRERANFDEAFEKTTVDIRLVLQNQLQCCGYFATNDSTLVNQGFCSVINNATQPCVGPITSFADITLNDIFTTVYGFAAVLIGLFLATLCVIKKASTILKARTSDSYFYTDLLFIYQRQEVERFKQIDSKRGRYSCKRLSTVVPGRSRDELVFDIMARRPPPSALKLYQGPMPTRSHPKHTLPARPCPALALPKLMPLYDIFFATSMQKSVFSDLRLPLEISGGEKGQDDAVTYSPLRGPWDRSRSFDESHIAIETLLKHPEPVVYAPMLI
ncbi:hypothetical protein Clacol_006748 [Clathrus columnatus]|uniref:Tetraspanin n=1 Tax=Clathrus columnatus TaxID=1419009 RepID=A0AAV5AKP7_9AGAM|nr:hypothetical protein Clacol_006748 [Clathrus columnatus]